MDPTNTQSSTTRTSAGETIAAISVNYGIVDCGSSTAYCGVNINNGIVVCLSAATSTASVLAHTATALTSSSPVSSLTNAILSCYVGSKGSAVKTSCPMTVNTSPYHATYACHVKR